MVTLPNLGLVAWNLSTDPYDSGQLATNWKKVDEHDHTSGKGLPITTAAIADGAVTTAKLSSGASTPPDGSITTAKLQNGAVTPAKFAASVIDDHVILMGGLRITVPTANTYIYGPGATNNGLASTSSAGLLVFYFDPAAFTSEAFIRLHTSLLVNDTAPAITFTSGLYPVTAVGGGGSANTITLGSVVAGTTWAVASPAANSMQQNLTAEVAPPAAGYYVFGCVASGTATTNSSVCLTTSLLVTT